MAGLPARTAARKVVTAKAEVSSFFPSPLKTDLFRIRPLNLLDWLILPSQQLCSTDGALHQERHRDPQELWGARSKLNFA